MIWGFRERRVGTVALNLRPRSGPWGGAAQWAAQVSAFLRGMGWRVQYDLRGVPDAVLLTHTGLSAGTTFGWEEVAEMRGRCPRAVVVHRINDNDVRKGTTGMDALVERTNGVATLTVFVSEWLRDYHAARWFDRSRPHTVIEPGADPAIFHPIGNHPPRPGGRWRLVTHHWSPNWAKGFDVYRELDRVIAEGGLPGVELWVIGRWPEEIRWRAAKTFGPVAGGRLADLLRQCHVYVSASRHEPGANHVVEGAQCGLPVLFHKESGGTASQCAPFGLEIGDDLAASVREMLERYAELRRRLLESPPSGHWMCLQYARWIQRLVAEAREAADG